MVVNTTLPVKELVDVLLEIPQKGHGRRPVVMLLMLLLLLRFHLVFLLLVLLLLLLRETLQQPSSVVLALGSLSAVVEVVLVGDADLLGLVADQADGAAHLGGDGALEAALAQQAVDRLHLVPA